MTTNELIEKTKEQIEFWKESKKHSPPFMWHDIDDEIKFCESTIYALSATIPLETAKCPPTEFVKIEKQLVRLSTIDRLDERFDNGKKFLFTRIFFTDGKYMDTQTRLSDMEKQIMPAATEVTL